MQKVLLHAAADEVEDILDSKMALLLKSRQIGSFIGIDSFDVIVFNMYSETTGKRPQVVIYFDKENILFFCEDDSALKHVNNIIREVTKEKQFSNEQLLYYFFMRLIKNDIAKLNEYESLITDIEDRAVFGDDRGCMEKIISYRKDLLRLKRYYEQLSLIFDDLAANENKLLTESGVHSCIILGNRTDRLFSNTVDLRDYIAQVLDVYQSQMDYRQNNLMKVFTVVTAIFLPLTLVTGWYGMNFKMPEYAWQFGYPTLIVLCAVVIVSLLIVFKKKKWI